MCEQREQPDCVSSVHHTGFTEVLCEECDIISILAFIVIKNLNEGQCQKPQQLIRFTILG